MDLPGYGFAKVSLSVKASWGSMVETYLKGRENLKAVIVIMDIRRDISVDDINLINWLIAYKRAIIPILTKVDKLNRRERESRTERLENAVADLNIDNPILFSARTREGKDVIWKRIEEALR